MYFLAAFVLLITTGIANAQTPYALNDIDLQDAFRNAQVINLRTSKISSVMKLRNVVKIPPPSGPVYVKIFTRNNLPAVLQPAFEQKGVMGVTLRGQYIAILKADFEEAYQDILAHELVHAYISQVNPKLMDRKFVAFQESSAVYFSINKISKVYAQADDKQIGSVKAQKMVIADSYQQRLHTFQYLVDKVGEKKFNKWYKNAVLTANSDATALIGINYNKPAPQSNTGRKFPILLGVLAGVVVLAVIGIGLYSVRLNNEENS